MNDIIKCKRCLNSKKPPALKLPSLKTNPPLVMRGITAGLVAEITGFNILKHGWKKKKEPVAGAGRGGKACGMVSAMGRMAESAAPVKREKFTPYKPVPQMHTLWSISDMRTGLV